MKTIFGQRKTIFGQKRLNLDRWTIFGKRVYILKKNKHTDKSNETESLIER